MNAAVPTEPTKEAKLPTISRTLSRLVTPAVLAAAIVACAIAPAAGAAVPKTGTWTGEMSQQLTFNAGLPYETNMVITAYKGRIQTVVATVRMECPESISIRDVRVLQGWKTGKGPKIGTRGGYAFKADGAYFHGTLSRQSAIGGATANYGDECRGVGRYNLQRKRF